MRKSLAVCLWFLLITGYAVRVRGNEAIEPEAPVKPVKQSTSVIYDLFARPPAWITWVSFFGGLGAFCWKLYEFYLSRSDRSKDHLIARDAFWYESIVVPRIVEPLLDFLISQNEKLKLLNKPDAKVLAQKFADFNRDYQDAYGELAMRIRILQVISTSTFTEIMSLLDGLEDSVTLFCFNAGSSGKRSSARRTGLDMDGVFSDALSGCVKKFMDLHFQLRHPK